MAKNKRIDIVDVKQAIRDGLLKTYAAKGMCNGKFPVDVIYLKDMENGEIVQIGVIDDKDKVPISAITDIVHETIYQFFDVVDDNSEEPISDKDKLLLEVNKTICNNLKSWANGAERIENAKADN